ncbi:bifunctional glycosyltransferase/CDP-glycerol:glycerophosphate glycerophosphotransferase [Microtetraspora niveoalba]|uniref:bifunctional glycosyltransferase/CDP-glycerol:glycerophosphate glycerophosphotransferase n=1 Tax=Microtetraspora niveoalba TaxID=46175 RepID=UPI0008357E9C|nr:CDP-glycerol glycerophosphotransferase family protein [Microtetraspora niveoalba]
MAVRPDVTVVVITYNDAARLPRAVGSLLRQSLRNLEIVVVDDGSTDDTARVVRDMPRVRYIRRRSNSGGCGAPRNAGMDAARAPYVMFLDSDDELPRHACKSLLTEIERTGADFVTGQISRLYEWSGRTAPYYPSLFRPRRVVPGIAADPAMFLDGFSTNKLYRLGFLREHGIRFREDLLYEDHIFTAAVYRAARRFAVVPWPVYLWHRSAGADPSISLRLGSVENARHRVVAAEAADRVLRRGGLAELVHERQRRFVVQDLRVYLNALPRFDAVWAKEFAAVVRPYLAALEPGVLDRAEPMVRVCAGLILADRVADLRVAARSLTGARAGPREAVVRDGRTYWGAVPGDAYDITDMRLAELPFSASRIRHEVTEASLSGTVLSLTVRTYDPFGVLDRHPPTAAHLVVGAQRVRLAPQRHPEGGYTVRAEADLSGANPRAFWWAGFHEPRIAFTRADGHVTSDRLLAEPSLPPLTASTPAHRVTVRPEGDSAVLRTVWERRGATGRVVRPLLALRRRIIRHPRYRDLKIRVYRGLVRVVPRRRDLVLFEADCGRGYTGHPRYIHEEIRRRGLPLRAVWSVSAHRRNFPGDVAKVRRMSWRYLWTMARAGWWVDSHGMPLGFPKPPGTRYLQTWHGQGSKSVGLDSPDMRGDFPGPREQWRANVARWDALVAPSAEFERIFVPANEYAGPLLRFGSPRCDVLVHGDAAAAARARDLLEIGEGVRVLLYAPTYRDRAKHSGRSVRVDLDRLAAELHPEWALILRTHPVERFAVPERLRHFVRPAGGYPEVNDLILAADALLTDYSSVMCDFAVTGKPIVLYTDDWEEYRRVERGLHHDLTEIAPGPCVTTTEELVRVLRDLPRDGHAWTPYEERYAAFRQMWCARETGEAAARVVDAFFAEAASPRRSLARSLASLVAGVVVPAFAGRGRRVRELPLPERPV